MDKKSHAIEIYEAFELNALRKRVIKKYKENLKQKGKSDTAESDIINFSSDKNAGIYESFIRDIERSIGRKFDSQTLVNFLFRKIENGEEIPLLESRKFRIKTISDLELYADTERTPHSSRTAKFKNIRFKGADLINHSFITKYGTQNRGNIFKDFYIGKKEDNLQWYGIIHKLDFPRSIREQLENHVINSFDKECYVVAVIHAMGGSGKTICLRRLAVDCALKNLNVLWITNLDDFVKLDLGIIQEANENCLLIVEDWESSGDHSEQINFLKKISDLDIIRVVIGDRSPIERKSYYKYLVEDGEYQLLYQDNFDIIEKILKYCPVWKVAAQKILTTRAFYSAPVYMIVFVLARISENGIHNETKGIVSIFRDIIANDLMIIGEHYPGLVKALFYYSHIAADHVIYINWFGLLKIADYYDKNTMASSRLKSFDYTDPVIKILSHYFIVKKLRSSFFQEVDYLLFHHPILIEDGLKKTLPYGCVKYQKNLRIEFVEILWEANAQTSVIDLLELIFFEKFSVYNSSSRKEAMKEFKNSDILNCFETGVFGYAGMLHLVIFDSMIMTFYNAAKTEFDERYWTSAISYFFKDIHVLSRQQRIEFFEEIIRLGCKSENVRLMYNYYLKWESKKLVEVFFSVKLFALCFQQNEDGTFKIWFTDDY